MKKDYKVSLQITILDAKDENDAIETFWQSVDEDGKFLQVAVEETTE